MIMETVETVENWNFKLCIDQKKLIDNLNEYFKTD